MAILTAFLALLIATSGFGRRWGQLPAGGQVNEDPAGRGSTRPRSAGISSAAGRRLFCRSRASRLHRGPRSRQGRRQPSQQISRPFRSQAAPGRHGGTARSAGKSSGLALSGAHSTSTQDQDAEGPSSRFSAGRRGVPGRGRPGTRPTPNLGGVQQVFAGVFPTPAQDRWDFRRPERDPAGAAPVTGPLNIEAETETPKTRPSSAGTPRPGMPPGSLDRFPKSGTTAAQGPLADLRREGPSAPCRLQCTGVKPAAPQTLRPKPPSWSVLAAGRASNRLRRGRRVQRSAVTPRFNVDPSPRPALQPDTSPSPAPNETVPLGSSGTSRARGPTSSRQQHGLFAAKATSKSSADGGMQWTSVGLAGQEPRAAASSTRAGRETTKFGACPRDERRRWKAAR